MEDAFKYAQKIFAENLAEKETAPTNDKCISADVFMSGALTFAEPFSEGAL